MDRGLTGAMACGWLGWPMGEVSAIRCHEARDEACRGARRAGAADNTAGHAAATGPPRRNGFRVSDCLPACSSACLRRSADTADAAE